MGRENWRPIEGYVGLYAISDHGQVMSMDYHRTGLPGLLQPIQKADGYLRVNLRNGDRARLIYIHALVMLAFVGPRPRGQQINHRDGVKANNTLANLEYCSPSENLKHAFRTGLKGVGEKHHQAKLNAQKISEIRNRLAAGESQRSLGREFGVSGNAIRDIGSGHTWAHIPFAGEGRVVN